MGTWQGLIRPVPSTALLGRHYHHSGGEGAGLAGRVVSGERSRGNVKKWGILQMVISEVFEPFLRRFLVSLMRSLIFLLM